MGLFDFFKKKSNPVVNKAKNTNTAVSEGEKEYYQPAPYYTDVVAEGTPFERTVITFEDRKKTAIPSNGGLYPAEILLLEYCSKGSYPKPKNGYPGFWWFTYGIRNVDTALQSLENRGYIVFGSAADSLKSLTVQQLKDILVTKRQPTTGKKADLVMRIAETISESDLLAAGIQPKYVLTEIGHQELEENAYVPYMHNAPNKTTEDDRFGMVFNVWSINKLLGTGDKSNWRAVVDEQERKIKTETVSNNDSFMAELKKINPDSYRKLKDQDHQIEAVQKAREKYNEDKDLNSYIAFWEMVWATGGLKFEGAKWHFELPDLYIKAKRYDDALAFVVKIKKTKPLYSDKADVYIQKIEERKAKSQR